jgi:hypothetical protein
MKPGGRFEFPSLSRMQKLFVTSFVFTFLVTVMAVLLFEPVRRYLVLPLEFIAWLFRSLYLLVPRQVMWVIFLVFAYWMAINSFQSRTKDPDNEHSPLPELYAEPKIARLARYISHSYRPFFRHRLNHILTELSLQVFAYRLQATTQQARLLLSRDRLDIPAWALEYFKQGLPPWPYQPGQPMSFLRRWKPGKQAQARALEQAEQALDFLEDYLEVPREQ